jgi:hypothetical protein
MTSLLVLSFFGTKKTGAAVGHLVVLWQNHPNVLHPLKPFLHDS